MSSKQASPSERIYEAWWQDGSIDLFAGLTAVLIGVAWILDAVILGPVAPAIIIPGWLVFRKQVVEPRLGHVRFDESRRRKLQRGHLVLIGMGCAALALGVAVYFSVRGDASSGDGLRSVIRGLPGILVGTGGVLAAFMFGIPRFALYALAFVLGGVAVIALTVDPGWSLLGGGVVTTLAGLTLLMKFLRQFPRLSNELE